MRLLTLLTVMFVSPAVVSAETAEGVIERIEAAEKEVNGARLKFSQETTLKGAGEKQELLGNLAILKEPDRFHVEFTSPVEQIVHYDGSHILVYFPETAQAFRQIAAPEYMSDFL